MKSFGYMAVIVLLVVLPARAQEGTGELLALTNNLRASLGLAPYTVNAALAAAAQTHAQWLANSGEVSHQGPDGSRPRDRARAAGYDSPWISENIYVGMRASPAVAWDFWVNSPVHYAGLTSPNYTEVGIAIVEGQSRSFVMVFGAPPGSRPQPRVSAAAGSSGGAGVAPAQPSFVVGLDAQGNIMHEVQEGDTLGDIALIYGYSWDVIPTMMALNNMAEADIYGLDVGSVVLVPPQAGTYTPTAATASATPAVTNTPLPTPSASAAPILMVAIAAVSTPTPPPLLPPATYIAPSATATPAPATHEFIVRTLPAQPDPVAKATPPQAAAAPGASNRSLVLGGAVIVQFAVLGLAVFEFIRRRS